jgi:methionyl-tRNA formyltransferase
LTVIGSGLLTDVLLADESKLSSAQEQSIAQKTATASKPTRELAKLDFSVDAASQVNKIRAMNPEPMAWFQFNETAIRVIRARQVSYSSDQAVGRVVDKELVVGCSEGSLVLELVQPAGKSQMSGADWFRGLRVENLRFS